MKLSKAMLVVLGNLVLMVAVDAFIRCQYNSAFGTIWIMSLANLAHIAAVAGVALILVLLAAAIPIGVLIVEICNRLEVY